MGTRGAWGVTRNADGSLAYLWEWPWYWRYLGGFAIAMVAVAVGFSIQGNQRDWVIALIVGGGVLFALAAMYELGCLVVVIAVIWALGAFLESLFPSLEISDRWLAVAAGIGALFAWNIAQKANALSMGLERKTDVLWQRVVDVDEDRKDATDDLYVRVRELERRLDRFDRPGEDW